MGIVVGSTSSIKLEAVCQACIHLNLGVSVVGVKAESGQNIQPVGFNETWRGAMNRAQRGRLIKPQRIAIGIENGIYRFTTKDGGMTIDRATVIVITKNHKLVVTQSVETEFPEDCVRIADQRGFDKTTVGAVIAEMYGGRADDPHSTISKGAVSRTTLIKATVIRALKLIPKEFLAPSS